MIEFDYCNLWSLLSVASIAACYEDFELTLLSLRCKRLVFAVDFFW